LRLSRRLQDRLGLGSPRRHDDPARGGARAQGPGHDADGDALVGHEGQRRAVPDERPDRNRGARQVRRPHRGRGQPAAQPPRVPESRQPPPDHEGRARLQADAVKGDSSPAAAKAYPFNAMQKLRAPSHTRALPLAELESLLTRHGLPTPRHSWYRLESDLESLLARSFPNPGDDDKIRELFRTSI